MTDTDIIRVELGLEVEPGRWRYSAPAYGVEGCSHQPLLDACRQIKSLWPETLSQQIGIYRRGKDKPELLCTVEVGAARTISESNSRGPYFAKFEPFDPAKWPTPDDGSASEDVEAHQPRKTRKTDVGTQARPAQRPSGETPTTIPASSPCSVAEGRASSSLATASSGSSSIGTATNGARALSAAPRRR
jgi:hypothetical protein